MTEGSHAPLSLAPSSPLALHAPPLPQNASDIQVDGLPPPAEVVEAIRNYVSSYFQLGFLHKALFVERYISQPGSVSEFLLSAICSIAAPFTPCLVARYGGKKKATDHFLCRADAMLGVEMVKPSLERTQAFLLLGVTEWGQGNGPKAWMLIGTAVRMAGFLGLHRETTYQLPPDPTAEAVIESEVARRTFWAVTCHENLLAGQTRPMQISLQEIDVYLPCEESEFNFGIQPSHRASIAGTLGHAANGAAVEGSKSLFASLVQVKILWSLTARHACRGSGRFEDVPWSTASQTLLTALQDFENSLPIKHRFSVTNLRGMMVEGLDLAFLSITLITRLSNIVLRRLYLPSMAVVIDPDGPPEMGHESRRFWQQMADDMISNSEQLLSQVETFFGMRSAQRGFPPIMVFGVYMCGNVFSYLCRWPVLCLSRAGKAERSYRRCVEILEALADSWPLAAQWHSALQSTNIDRRDNDEGNTGLNGQDPSRLRSAARDERTLDDEMAGIYGQAAQSIVSSSPDDPSLLSNRIQPQPQSGLPAERQSHLHIPQRPYSHRFESLGAAVPINTRTNINRSNSATGLTAMQQAVELFSRPLEGQSTSTALANIRPSHLLRRQSQCQQPAQQMQQPNTYPSLGYQDTLPTYSLSLSASDLGGNAIDQGSNALGIQPDFGYGFEGAGASASGPDDFFLDTFGEDLSAFLQSGVPVGNGPADGGPDGLSHLWER